MLLKDVKDIHNILSKTDVIVSIYSFGYGNDITIYSNYSYISKHDWERYSNNATLICEEYNRPLKVKDGTPSTRKDWDRIKYIVFNKIPRFL